VLHLQVFQDMITHRGILKQLIKKIITLKIEIIKLMKVKHGHIHWIEQHYQQETKKEHLIIKMKQEVQ